MQKMLNKKSLAKSAIFSSSSVVYVDFIALTKVVIADMLWACYMYVNTRVHGIIRSTSRHWHWHGEGFDNRPKPRHS